MEKNFMRIFDEWLFQKEKTFNPFTKYLAEQAKDFEIDEPNEICPECGEESRDDARVENGMKCGPCSYGC